MSNFYTYGGAALMSEIDTWTTPRDFYNKLNNEFNFGLDAAALQSSTLVADNWYGPDHPDTTRQDALVRNWTEDAEGKMIWLNPPYGRSIKLWTAKAHLENQRGGGHGFATSSPHRYFMVAQSLHQARSQIYTGQIEIRAEQERRTIPIGIGYNAVRYRVP